MPQAVVAKVSAEINLAKPKSDTLINLDLGSLLEYKIFSGYIELFMTVWKLPLYLCE